MVATTAFALVGIAYGFYWFNKKGKELGQRENQLMNLGKGVTFFTATTVADARAKTLAQLKPDEKVEYETGNEIRVSEKVVTGKGTNDFYEKTTSFSFTPTENGVEVTLHINIPEGSVKGKTYQGTLYHSGVYIENYMKAFGFSLNSEKRREIYTKDSYLLNVEFSKNLAIMITSMFLFIGPSLVFVFLPIVGDQPLFYVNYGLIPVLASGFFWYLYYRNKRLYESIFY